MQDISSIIFSGIVETSDVLIAGVRGVVRRLSSGLTAKATKLAMPVSPSSILPRLR